MKLLTLSRPFAVALGALCCTAMALAQGNSQHFDVFDADHYDRSPSLKEMAKATIPISAQAQTVFLGRIPFNGDSGAPAASDPTQHAPLPYSNASVGAGIEGLGVGFPGFTVRYAPPDTNAAVGLTQVVQWVNTYFVVFDKATGAVVQAPTPGNALWAGFGGGCQKNNDGDPVVQYDKAAQRWVFTQFSVSTKPYLQCFAISSADDLTAPTTTFTRFAFSFGNTNFPDYPKLGVWSDGYYLSFNIFRNGFIFSGPKACVVDRATALAGGSPTMICAQLSSSTGSLLPSDLDGSTPPPFGSPDYFVTFGTNSLKVYKFHADFVVPSSSTFTGPTTLSVAAFSPACNGGTCIPQPGTSQQLDSLADRLMYRFAYRNNNNGTESLVVNHSIKTTGAASTVRWYELRLASTVPSVFQTGTLDSSDGISRWMGSIAMDHGGNIALGYSVSKGSSIYPGIRITGRSCNDSPGTTQAETTIINGTGSQTANLNRWGDYSSMAVDPVDDKTFWYTTEYMTANGTFNWHTRLASFTIGTCP